MDFERDEGKTLTCVATPRSDVTIEADIDVDEGGRSSIRCEDFTGTVVALDDIARETRRLVIELDHEMTFNPGQYVMIDVPGDRTSPGPTRWRTRPASRAVSSCRSAGPRAASGTDGWIFKTLAVGDPVQRLGPYGRFVHREARTEPAILIGGGTGLAPLKSIIRHVLETGLPSACTSTRVPARRPTCTTSTSTARWRRSTRAVHLPALPVRRAVGRRRGAWSPTWSPPTTRPAGAPATSAARPPMVEAALKTLMRKRLFPRDIYREDFFDASDKATGGVRSPLLKA